MGKGIKLYTYIKLIIMVKANMKDTVMGDKTRVIYILTRHWGVPESISGENLGLLWFLLSDPNFFVPQLHQ